MTIACSLLFLFCFLVGLYKFAAGFDEERYPVSVALTALLLCLLGFSGVVACGLLDLLYG